jgi:ribosomal protein S18 acetylase RimI-like enzyme
VAYAHVFTAVQLGSISEEGSAEWWREALARRFPRAHTLVAETEQDVVGFASIGPARDAADDEGELYAIYVLPEASGRGIGQALMAEVLSRLRRESFAEAILWVLEDNPRTRRFYELAGWRTDGVVKEEEWLGALVREIRYRIALDPSRQ